MSKSGQKQSQTKGRSNLPPLDTGSESNLIMFCRLQIGYVWTEVIRKKSCVFKWKRIRVNSALISKTIMYVHQTFVYISLTSVHEYDVKFSQVTFYDVDVTFFITLILRYPPETTFFAANYLTTTMATATAKRTCIRWIDLKTIIYSPARAWRIRVRYYKPEK